jgi:hypothetical protein
MCFHGDRKKLRLELWSIELFMKPVSTSLLPRCTESNVEMVGEYKSGVRHMMAFNSHPAPMIELLCIRYYVLIRAYPMAQRSIRLRCIDIAAPFPRIINWH